MMKCEQRCKSIDILLLALKYPRTGHSLETGRNFQDMWRQVGTLKALSWPGVVVFIIHTNGLKSIER